MILIPPALTDLVPAHEHPPGTQTDFDISATDAGRTYMAGGHRMRSMWGGTIPKVRITFGSLTYLDRIKFQVYRWNGATFDCVGGSEEIPVSSLAIGDHYLTLGTPIENVKRGDFLGCTFWATSEQQFLGVPYTNPTMGMTWAAQDAIWYYSAGEITGSGFSWAYTRNQRAMLWTPYMSAPRIVECGDSFAAGHVVCYSFIEPISLPYWYSNNVEQSILGYAEECNESLFRYANIGIGSTTTTQWLNTYISQYLLPLKPRVALISLGCNDTDVLTRGQFCENIVKVWQTCRLNGIIPVQMELSAVATPNLKKHAWNAALHRLAAEHQIEMLNSYRVLETLASRDSRNTTLYGAAGHCNAAGYKTLGVSLAGLCDAQGS